MHGAVYKVRHWKKSGKRRGETSIVRAATSTTASELFLSSPVRLTAPRHKVVVTSNECERVRVECSERGQSGADRRRRRRARHRPVDPIVDPGGGAPCRPGARRGGRGERRQTAAESGREWGAGAGRRTGDGIIHFFGRFAGEQQLSSTATAVRGEQRIDSRHRFHVPKVKTSFCSLCITSSASHVPSHAMTRRLG